MAKRGRVAKKPRKATISRRREVSRYEYAQLCLHLARVEALATRNRAELDIQLRRIAQIQDELDLLKKTQPIPSDAVLIPLPKSALEG